MIINNKFSIAKSLYIPNISKTLPGYYNSKTIYVNIPSYADNEIWPTIDDIFLKAVHKNRIFIGITHQSLDIEKDKKIAAEYLNKYSPNLRINVVPAGSIVGCQPARKQTHNLYNGQDYYLNTDSHVRMIDRWDEELIFEFEMVEYKQNNMAVISISGNQYGIDENGEYVFYDQDYPCMYFMEDHFIDFFKKSGTVIMTPTIVNITEEVASPFLSGHFWFTRASYVEQVQYVDKITFSQEELFMYLRFFTAGINIYNPKRNYVYHYFDRAEVEEGKELKRSMIWDDFPDKFYDANEKSRKHFCWVIEENIIDHKNGLFDKRTIKDYEDMFGINFKNRTVDNKLRNIEYPTTYR